MGGVVQICGRCKLEFPLSEFSASHQGKSGTWCRRCVTAYAAWKAGRGPKPESAEHPARACEHCGRSYTPKQIKANSRYCSRECGQASRVSSGRARDSYLKRIYGISHADYERMLRDQGGGCALCGRKPSEQTRYTSYLHVDHCHVTGRVRGLLCDEHNLLIGRWNHDPDLLRRAADYLE